MTTERRAATRRFAFKGPRHGGPLGRIATQRHKERATSVCRRGERRTLSLRRRRAPIDSDFPTRFPTAAAVIEESLEIERDRPTPVAVSKTGMGVSVHRGFESPLSVEITGASDIGNAAAMLTEGVTLGRRLGHSPHTAPEPRLPGSRCAALRPHP